MTFLRALAVAGLAILFPLSAGLAADAGRVSIELNKLEQEGADCQSYLVIRNPDGPSYSEFDMEVLVFDTDGIIQKRLAVNLAPVKKGRTTVYIAALADLQCQAVGEVLVNGFFACMADGTAVSDCVDRVDLSSRGSVKLFKQANRVHWAGRRVGAPSETVIP